MPKQIESENKLNAKDLMTIGVFTAITSVLTLVISFVSFFPAFLPLLAVLIPVIEGIPYMLFLTKTKKFGMITIFGLLNGTVDCFCGMGVYAILTGLIFGLLADIISKSGKYQSKGKSVLSCGAYFMWLVGNYIPIVVARDAYYENLLKNDVNQEYIDTLTKVIPDWILPVILVVSFICGIVGGIIGTKTLKKHFEKAGITG